MHCKGNKTMKKKIIKQLTIFNFDVIEEFLEKQHKEGWKLTKIKPFGVFYFEECESEDMVYFLDKDNFSIMDDKNPYLDKFAANGWEFIQMYRNFNFFRKKKEDFDCEEIWTTDRQEHFKEIEKFYSSSKWAVLVALVSLLPTASRCFRNGDYIFGLMIGLCIILGIAQYWYYGKSYKILKEKYFTMEEKNRKE